MSEILFGYEECDPDHRCSACAAKYATPASIPVLDHGYVRPVEHWGSDSRIVEAARMSTSGGFVSWEPYEKHPRGDRGLLEYLWKHKHATPFEMAGLVIEVQAPIFVFREWHRHRTQSYNEMSARYTLLPDLNYVPSVERIMANANGNKQAAAMAETTEQAAEAFRNHLMLLYERDEQFYRTSLAAGIPKELARLVLPVGRYSRMRASANLRNWLAFLTLHLDPAAQWEIRQFAQAVGSLIAERFPETWKLFIA